MPLAQCFLPGGLKALADAAGFEPAYADARTVSKLPVRARAFVGAVAWQVHQHFPFGVGDRALGTVRFRLRDLSIPPTGRDVNFTDLELQHGEVVRFNDFLRALPKAQEQDEGRAPSARRQAKPSRRRSRHCTIGLRTSWSAAWRRWSTIPSIR